MYKPQWIIVWKLKNGSIHYGPFDTHREAQDWAKENLAPNILKCEIKLLHHPSMGSHAPEIPATTTTKLKQA